MAEGLAGSVLEEEVAGQDGVACCEVDGYAHAVVGGAEVYVVVRGVADLVESPVHAVRVREAVAMATAAGVENRMCTYRRRRVQKRTSSVGETRTPRARRVDCETQSCGELGISGYCGVGPAGVLHSGLAGCRRTSGRNFGGPQKTDRRVR